MIRNYQQESDRLIARYHSIEAARERAARGDIGLVERRTYSLVLIGDHVSCGLATPSIKRYDEGMERWYMVTRYVRMYGRPAPINGGWAI